MADFCKQCSEAIFGEDLKEMRGLGGKVKGLLPPKFGWEVLCEGCGPTLVDNEGRCIFVECPKHGEKEKGANPV